jgi:hypothetical protein
MCLPNNGFSHKYFYTRIIILLLLFLSTMVLPLENRANTLAKQASTPISCIYQPSTPSVSAATPAPAISGTVLINEILPFPTLPWNCAVPETSYQTDGWIEIYNPQDLPLDLYAARATLDEGPGTPSYTLQPDAIIPAHGFFTCFPFMRLTTNSTPNPLSLRLLISQTVIDQVTTPSLPLDTSYARIPNGSNSWQITTTPTINSTNDLPTTPTSGTSTHTRPTPRSHTTPTVHPTHQNNTPNHATMTTINIQPTWSALWFPSTRSPDTSLSSFSTPTTITPNSVLSENNIMLPVKILLTTMMLLLPGIMFWQWKFLKKRKKKQH